MVESLLYKVGFVTIQQQMVGDVAASDLERSVEGLRVHRDDRCSADRAPAAGGSLTLLSISS
jgi:hypothetical protein